MKKKTKLVLAISIVVFIIGGFLFYQYDKANKPIRDKYRDYITNVSDSTE